MSIDDLIKILAEIDEDKRTMKIQCMSIINDDAHIVIDNDGWTEVIKKYSW